MCPAVKSVEPAVLDRHQVAADRPSRRAPARCPWRRPPAAPGPCSSARVVAEEAERGHVAGGKEPVGDVPRPAHDSFARDRSMPVACAPPGAASCRPATLRLVGGTIGNHDHIFRGMASLRLAGVSPAGPIQSAGLVSSVFHPQANARRTDHVEPVDLAQGGVQLGLDGQVGHDHQRHRRLLSGASSPGSCWMTLAMLIPCSPRIRATCASTPGRVGDGEPQVVAAPDLVRGRQRGTAAAGSDQRSSTRERQRSPGRSPRRSGRRPRPTRWASCRLPGRKRSVSPTASPTTRTALYGPRTSASGVPASPGSGPPAARGRRSVSLASASSLTA